MWKSGEWYGKRWDNPRILAQSEVQPELERQLGISRKKFKDNVNKYGMNEYLKQIAKDNPSRYKLAKTSLKEPTLEVNLPMPGVGRETNTFQEYQKGGKKSGKMLENFQGPTHENGGIDINVAEVEGGETEFDPEDYIFSDTLKVPDTNQTFAEKSKQINKKYKGDNRFTRNAKRRELKKLMEQQEEVRAKDRGQEEMQQGGFLPGSESTGLDIMSLAAPATTAAMTIGDIFSKPVEADLPRLRGEAYTPQLISREPYAREVERTFGEQERAVTRGARTPGQYMAGRIQTATEESKAKSDIMRQIDQINREERARAEEMAFEQQLQNLQQATREQQMQMKSEAARRNAIRQGLSSLATQFGQISSDIRRSRAQEDYRDRYLDLLSGAFPDVSVSKEGAEINPMGSQSNINQNFNTGMNQDYFMNAFRNYQQNGQIDLENDDTLWNYENFTIE
jgi:hypothetical protein